MTQIQIKPGTLTRLCKQLDCSRDALARKLDVSSSTTFRIDAGLVNPSTKFIAALMLTTGEPFESLFVITDKAAA